MTKPLFSIIMPSYNTQEDHLRAAIDSMLAQTEKDFELIIIDDGSKENDFDIINSYKDSRIKAFRNQENMGISKTLNRGLSLATGKFISRMDSDDISYKNRLKNTAKFLNNNPRVDMVGTWKKNFGESSRTRKYYIRNEDIRAMLFFDCPFAHPSVTFRSDSVEKYSIEYSSSHKAEDYWLWYQLSKNKDFTFANINRVLLNYRVHPKQLTQKGKFVSHSAEHVIEDLLSFSDIKLDSDEFRLYIDFCYSSRKIDLEDLEKVDRIFCKILLNNNEIIATQASLKKVLSEKFLKGIIWQRLKFKNRFGNLNNIKMIDNKIFKLVLK